MSEGAAPATPTGAEPSGDVTISTAGGTKVKFGKKVLVAAITALVGVGGVGAWSSSSDLKDVKAKQDAEMASRVELEGRMTKQEWETYWLRTEVRAGFERLGIALNSPAPQKPASTQPMTQMKE